MPNFILLWIYSRSIWLLTWLNVCNVICLPLCDVINFEINIIFFDQNVKTIMEITSWFLKGFQSSEIVSDPTTSGPLRREYIDIFFITAFWTFISFKLNILFFGYNVHIRFIAQYIVKFTVFGHLKPSKFDRRLVAQTIVMHWTDSWPLFHNFIFKTWELYNETKNRL